MHIQSGIDDHSNQFRGLVVCVCASCGVRFDREGSQVLQKSVNVKTYTYINQKKIINACNRGDLSLLQPRSESDWIVMRTNLCDECLHGFRKPQSSVSRGGDGFYDAIKDSVK